MRPGKSSGSSVFQRFEVQLFVPLKIPESTATNMKKKVRAHMPSPPTESEI
jgi:hypothetical protein